MAVWKDVFTISDNYGWKWKCWRLVGLIKSSYYWLLATGNKGSGGWGMDNIAPDKRGIHIIFFSYFSTKTYVVGTHLKRLGEALQMSTHNIYFCGDKRKMSVIFGWNITLSGAILYGFLEATLSKSFMLPFRIRVYSCSLDIESKILFFPFRVDPLFGWTLQCYAGLQKKKKKKKKKVSL